MLLTLGIVVAFLDITGAVSCPNGFEAHEEGCYLFSHGEETWIGAFESCKLFNNAALVEVNDAAEDAYLSNKTASLNDYFWMGLTDKLIEGEYMWETSLTSVFDTGYTGWASSEPDGRDDENCVFFAKSRSFMWADADCTRRQRYICELLPGEGGTIIG